jgi:hypothetical protein
LHEAGTGRGSFFVMWNSPYGRNKTLRNGLKLRYGGIAGYFVAENSYQSEVYVYKVGVFRAVWKRYKNQKLLRLTGL